MQRLDRCSASAPPKRVVNRFLDLRKIRPFQSGIDRNRWQYSFVPITTLIHIASGITEAKWNENRA
jgi:hypothetical protein